MPAPERLVLPRLRWQPRFLPPRIHEFIYSKANLLVSLFVASVAYLLLAGQPELVRRAVAVFVFAALCWVLEVFPYPITGLMVPVACALTGVLPPADAFEPFAREVIFIFLGGLVMAEALVKFKLDRRLALYILRKSGGDPDRLVLLLMYTVGLLSMWISNTVTVLVLLPTVLTIISALPRDQPNIGRKLLLGMAISSCVGGIGMLTGSPPNLIAADALSSLGGFSFLQWAYYCFPIAIACIALSYIALKRLFPTGKVSMDLREVEAQAARLGPFTGGQIRTLAIFGATVTLFLVGENFERLLGLPPSLPSPAVASILSVLMLFGAGLLRLEEVRGMRFDLIFLIGGGLVLGQALLRSGTAKLIGDAVGSVAGGAPLVLVLLLVILLTVLLTNFMSNTATAGIMVPIAVAVSGTLGVGPVPLVLAAGASASIAFLTPVGTPSTAIVFSSGGISKKDLLAAGLASGALIVLFTALWLSLVPAW